MKFHLVSHRLGEEVDRKTHPQFLPEEFLGQARAFAPKSGEDFFEPEDLRLLRARGENLIFEVGDYVFDGGFDGGHCVGLVGDLVAALRTLSHTTF